MDFENEKKYQQPTKNREKFHSIQIVKRTCFNGYPEHLFTTIFKCARSKDPGEPAQMGSGFSEPSLIVHTLMSWSN